ncbi:uncharacterized protein LOC111008986 [Momordica charantia]|uniref:Uncharacterized protein LOC111008986 n=1 Tax=Momordica charantia TaxID=3673 RepID=A0A6J1C7L7_MOMCH|nr:uncharacterized protein LOC111008986 [Momordica charantia]
MRKMRGRGLISPPKSRFSVTESDSQNNAAANPPSMPNYMSATRRSTAARVVNPKQQQTTHTKPTFGSNAIRATKNSSPKPTPVVPSRRRPTWAPNNPNGHNDNSTTKLTIAKITTSRNSNVNGVQQQPRGPTLISVASGSSHGSGHHQDANNNNIEGEEEDSTTVIGHPHVINQLQQLSIDGKHHAKMVFRANSMDESVGPYTKEECSPQSNAERILEIYKDIASHRQGNSSITSYFTKLETLWEELETYSDLPQCCSYSATDQKPSKLVEREKVMQFLVGLNDSYSTICSQILLIRPFPTVEKAYSIIIMQE